MNRLFLIISTLLISILSIESFVMPLRGRSFLPIRECQSYNQRASQLFNQKQSTGDKVRVRLLQDTPQGKKNEIVMVSKALWTNVLLPKKQGEKITDEMMEKMNQDAINTAAQELSKALEFSGKLSANGAITRIVKKVGSNGQLFGSVNHKAIIDHVRTCISHYDSVIDSKAFQVTEIFEYKADKSVNRAESIQEIRRGGKYRVRVKVHPKAEEVEFDLEIGA